MKKIVNKITFHFLQGVFALLPIFISGYIIIFVFNVIENIFDKALIFAPLNLQENLHYAIVFKLIVAIVMFLFMVIFGIFVRSVAGKSIMKWADRVFRSIPGFSPLYKAIKDTVEAFTGEKNSFFVSPVLVEYPSKDIWVIGFNTGNAKDIIPKGDDEIYYSVFIPTTPNPTSGFLVILPETKVKNLDLTAEEAIKIVLTGGVVKK